MLAKTHHYILNNLQEPQLIGYQSQLVVIKEEKSGLFALEGLPLIPIMLLEGAFSIFVVTALLVTHLLASPVVLHPSLKLEWESWKSTHEKTYEHEREESERSVVWMNNKKLIDTHNAVVEDNGYTLAMNEFGDMVGICMSCFI